MGGMRGESGKELHVVGDRVLIAPDEARPDIQRRTWCSTYRPTTSASRFTGSPVRLSDSPVASRVCGMR